MHHRHSTITALLCFLTLAGCERPLPSALRQPDTRAAAPTMDEIPTSGPEEGVRSEGRGAFQRYVAIGTSVSMGVASDGVRAESQAVSWPAQLARLAGRELSIPAIADPGCGAPLAAPLASGLRISGEPAGRPDDATAICAPNLDGVVLPAGNVAIDGATTRDALYSTTATYAGRLRGGEYARVLPPGETQISAMLAQNPKIVSVELGANELLGMRKGVWSPGTVEVPVSAWKPLYTRVLDAVQSTAKYVVLVGLTRDAANFPSFRSGLELWNARASLTPFNVVVGEDCGTTNATNVLFVAVRVPVAVANGVAQARMQQGPYTLRCDNAPSWTGIEDYVLTAEEMALANQQLAEMSAFIREQAQERGWAYFELEALYGRSDAKPPFNALMLMTTAEPYGPYFSLDGTHPSAAGQRILADAAAMALNDRYGFGIPLSSEAVAATTR